MADATTTLTNNQTGTTGTNTSSSTGTTSSANTGTTSDGSNLVAPVLPSDSSNPGTGTTGTTASAGGSFVDGVLGAIQNPSTPTINFSNGQGTQFQAKNYNGQSISTMSDLANDLGIQYTKDPSTGAISIGGKSVNPVGYDSNGVPIVQVRQVLNAMGVPDQSIQYDAKTGNVSYTMPQQQTQQSTPQSSYGNFNIPYTQPYQMPSMSFGGMPSMPTITPYQAPNLQQYYQNLMPMQQSFTPDWNTYYSQAHAQFDPTTNADIQSLNTKMNSDIVAGDEKMNQRGIFNSGIAQANENDIRAKTSDAIAKVLATSQSNIAKVAQQLYTDAFDQYYKGNTMAIQNNQMWLNQAMNTEKQAYTEWLGQQNLSISQFNAAVNAWDKAANLGLQQAKMQMDNSHFYDNLNQQASIANQKQDWSQYQYNNLSKQQQTTDAISQQKNQLDLFKMLGYVQNPDGSITPTEQATVDKQNLAIKLAQTLGYITNPDGTITQTEQARHNLAQDVLNQEKLTENVRHDKQLESIDWAKVSVSQKQLDETISNNLVKAKEFSATMKNTQLKEQVDALTKQMQDSNGNLKSLYDRRQKIIDAINATTDPQQKQNLQSEIDDPTNGIRQQIAEQMAQLQNAQDGINQRLKLDNATNEANANLGK